jgi:hypothetical protein
MAQNHGVIAALIAASLRRCVPASLCPCVAVSLRRCVAAEPAGEAGYRVTSAFKFCPQIVLASILSPPGPGQCVSSEIHPS